MKQIDWVTIALGGLGAAMGMIFSSGFGSGIALALLGGLAGAASGLGLQTLAKGGSLFAPLFSRPLSHDQIAAASRITHTLAPRAFLHDQHVTKADFDQANAILDTAINAYERRSDIGSSIAIDSQRPQIIVALKQHSGLMMALPNDLGTQSPSAFYTSVETVLHSKIDLLSDQLSKVDRRWTRWFGSQFTHAGDKTDVDGYVKEGMEQLSVGNLAQAQGNASYIKNTYLERTSKWEPEAIDHARTYVELVNLITLQQQLVDAKSTCANHCAREVERMNAETEQKKEREQPSQSSSAPIATSPTLGPATSDMSIPANVREAAKNAVNQHIMPALPDALQPPLPATAIEGPSLMNA